MTPMEELIADLEDRSQYVVTLWRTAPDDMDDQADNAFAFVLGTEAATALVVEGSITGDGKSAVATVWGVTQDGGKVEPELSVFDGTVMITQHLD